MNTRMVIRGRRWVRALAAAVSALACSLATADDVHVAVAANFATPMQAIAQAFERHTGHKALLSFGATGKFHAQIRHGAPFAVLLAADDTTPARLIREGLAEPDSNFTYAVGRLVLWSARPGLVDPQGQVLRGTMPGKLAVADPRLSPYGAAAAQALARLQLTERVRPHLVIGENIGQAFQFVRSGNAAMGLVALSQVMAEGQITSGSTWLVPADVHEPIRQDAVLLRAGAQQPAARALLQYLRSDAARQVIRAHGYTP